MLKLLLIFIFCSGSALAAEPFLFRSQALTLPNGERVEARLKIPAKRSGPLPMILLFGGVDHGDRVLNLFDAPEPMIVATMPYRFKGPKGVSGLKNILNYAGETKERIHLFRKALPQLLQNLSNLPEVDGNKVVVIGASFGTLFALDAAARHPEKFPLLVLLQGFGKVPSILTHSLMKEWKMKFGKLTPFYSYLLAQTTWVYLWFPAPERSARNLAASQKVLSIHARVDDFVPRECTETLLKGLRAGKAQLTVKEMEGGHLGQNKHHLVHQLLNEVIIWLRQQNFFSPGIPG